MQYDFQSDKLNETLQQPWLCASKWRELREAIVWFSDRIRDYADYLASKCKEVSESHKLMQSTGPKGYASFQPVTISNEPGSYRSG